MPRRSPNKRSRKESKQTDVVVDSDDSGVELKPPKKRRRQNNYNSASDETDSDYVPEEEEMKENDSDSEADDIDEEEYNEDEKEDDEVDYSVFKVSELKQMCRDNGLKVSGNKNALIQRLENKYDPEHFSRSMSVANVNQMLTDLLGLEHPDRTSLCFRSAIAKGHFSFRGDDGTFNRDSILSKVICEGSCFACDEYVECTLGDAMFQRDDPYYCDLPRWTPEITDRDFRIVCENGHRNYLAGMCDKDQSHLKIDSEQGVSHCRDCPGFGTCMGYRRQHCSICGEHYEAGSMKQMVCGCRYTNEQKKQLADRGKYGGPIERPDIMAIFAEIRAQMQMQRDSDSDSD